MTDRRPTEELNSIANLASLVAMARGVAEPSPDVLNQFKRELSGAGRLPNQPVPLPPGLHK